jgi:hypothetical protein
MVFPQEDLEKTDGSSPLERQRGTIRHAVFSWVVVYEVAAVACHHRSAPQGFHPATIPGVASGFIREQLDRLPFFPGWIRYLEGRFGLVGKCHGAPDPCSRSSPVGRPVQRNGGWIMGTRRSCSNASGFAPRIFTPSQNWEAAVPQAGSFRQQLIGDIFNQLIYSDLHNCCANGTSHANQGQSSPMIWPILTICGASTRPAGSPITLGLSVDRPSLTTNPRSLS